MAAIEETSENSDRPAVRRSSLVIPGAVLGLGMGGFVDGIVLHQILQWHQMLTARVPANTVLNKEINMFWDGVFHAFTWTAVMIGIALLWRNTGRSDFWRSTPAFIASLFLGWGIFNLVEGVINHHILKLHNVRDIIADSTWWNLSFLASGVIFIVVAWLIIARAWKGEHLLL